MKPFTTKFDELSGADLATLRITLSVHPHITAMARGQNKPAREFVEETLSAWRDGILAPVHDTDGLIVGFGEADQVNALKEVTGHGHF